MLGISHLAREHRNSGFGYLPYAKEYAQHDDIDPAKIQLPLSPGSREPPRP
jgi:hypothetical protein